MNGKDDLEGVDRWTIRIPDGQPGDSEQRELSNKLSEVSPDALAAFMATFPTDHGLDEYLKDFPTPQDSEPTN